MDEEKERIPSWPIGSIHPEYGECQMIGITGGEAYRWFVKDNLVTMIPLSFIDEEYARTERTMKYMQMIKYRHGNAADEHVQNLHRLVEERERQCEKS
jgi:hypothetical protein